jgi:hypothetical protein
VTVAPDEPEEPARFSVSGLFLVRERELQTLERFEELVPIDIFRSVVVTELDARQSLAIFIFRAFDHGRPAAAGFDRDRLDDPSILNFDQRYHRDFA